MSLMNCVPLRLWNHSRSFLYGTCSMTDLGSFPSKSLCSSNPKHIGQSDGLGFSVLHRFVQHRLSETSFLLDWFHRRNSWTGVTASSAFFLLVTALLKDQTVRRLEPQKIGRKGLWPSRYPSDPLDTADTRVGIGLQEWSQCNSHKECRVIYFYSFARTVCGFLSRGGRM